MTNLELLLQAMQLPEEWQELSLLSLGFERYSSSMWIRETGDVGLQIFTGESHFTGGSCNACSHIHRPFALAMECYLCRPTWSRINERHADHLRRLGG